MDRAGAGATLGLGRAPEESALTQGFIPSQGGSQGVFGKRICQGGGRGGAGSEE